MGRNDLCRGGLHRIPCSEVMIFLELRYHKLGSKECSYLLGQAFDLGQDRQPLRSWYTQLNSALSLYRSFCRTGRQMWH